MLGFDNFALVFFDIELYFFSEVGWVDGVWVGGESEVKG